jgi:hypothetical protein
MTKHFDNKSAYKFQSDKNRKKRDKRRAIIDGYPVLHPFETREDVAKYFDNDKITCLQCGKKYNALNSHLAVHEMTVEEYQNFYQLPLSVGLVGKLARERLVERANDLREKGIFNKAPPKEYAGEGGKEYKRPLYRRLEQKEFAKTMRTPIGEKAANALLTEEKVRAIKSDTTHTMKELAEIYGTSWRNIQSILSGNTWKHVAVEVKRPRYVKRVTVREESAQ